MRRCLGVCGGMEGVVMEQSLMLGVVKLRAESRKEKSGLSESG